MTEHLARPRSHASWTRRATSGARTRSSTARWRHAGRSGRRCLTARSPFTASSTAPRTRRSSCCRTRSGARSRCGTRRWPRSPAPARDPLRPARARRLRRSRPAPYDIAISAGRARPDRRARVERAHVAASRSAARRACGSAANAPERVDRLVLCTTSPHFGRRRRGRSERPPRAPRGPAPSRAGVDRWFTPAFAERVPVVARLRDMIASTRRGLRRLLRRARADWTCATELPHDRALRRS